MRIEDSGLSVRAVNALRRAGIFTLEDAQALGEEGLEAQRGVGGITAREILSGQRRCVPRAREPLTQSAGTTAATAGMSPTAWRRSVTNAQSAAGCAGCGGCRGKRKGWPE